MIPLLRAYPLIQMVTSSSFSWETVAAIVLFAATTIELSATVISDKNPPPGIVPGDQFRVIFVTSGSRDATSQDMLDYDLFVQSHAPPFLTTNWRAIGSTGTIDARVHTETIPGSDGLGIPFFNMQGKRIAASYSHLWSTTFPSQSPPILLDNPVTYDELGNSPGNISVWSGTGFDGIAIRSPFALGDATPVIGANWRTGALWIDTGVRTNTDQLRMYGISDTLTFDAQLGDANLDGVVDGSDFGIWNANKFTSGVSWATGDFNGDGVADGSDFGIWNANKFTASTIPEPVFSSLFVLFAWYLYLRSVVATRSTRRAN